MIAGLGDTRHRPPPPLPQSKERWPLNIRLLAALKTSTDTGVGDTVERIAQAIKADKVAAAYEEVTRRPCGCQDRKERLNKQYPYLTEKRSPP